MEERTKFFYLPFIALLAYTFGMIFSLSAPLGVNFSPGRGIIAGGMLNVLISLLLFIVILSLFFSVKKKRRDKSAK
mgnify:FL=1